jgi:hypothetical protein
MGPISLLFNEYRRDSLTKAQWIKLRESWPKFKVSDSHEMLKNLAEGQKQVLRRMKMLVL